jgi:hypothetical protein
MTAEEHNKYIAYTFIAHGVFQLLMLLLIGVMFYFIFSLPARPGDPGPPPAFFAIFFSIMFIIQGLFTAPSFLAAYAMLKKKSWARIASIIGAVLAGMHVPIGTAACVYSLWFFFGDNWKSVYPEQGNEVAHDPKQLVPADQWQWNTPTADEFEFQPEKQSGPPDWR